MINGKKIILGLDVSTSCIGVCILLEDGSDYGKIIELTHISPKISARIKGVEQLFIKKRIFEKFISNFKDFGIDEVIIEEPLLRSNNINTCGTLLRFNGMISECIYNQLNIIPEYISSYDARKFAFPELMSARKYSKDDQLYEFDRVMNEIVEGRLVLFGSMPWTVDKKIIIHSKVSQIFPEIEWVYDNNSNELRKENFDATDAYVAILGYVNRKKFGDLKFKVTNITTKKHKDKKETEINFDVSYWNKNEKRTVFIPQKSSHNKKGNDTGLDL